jgi:hypothetical protein
MSWNDSFNRWCRNVDSAMPQAEARAVAEIVLNPVAWHGVQSTTRAPSVTSPLPLHLGHFLALTNSSIKAHATAVLRVGSMSAHTADLEHITS